jgi:hypothetical protein
MAYRRRPRVIFDRLCGFRLPFDVCSSLKATCLLRGNEMTRRAQPVWKLKIPKLDENDILVFALAIEWACNASTSNGLE